MFILHREKAAPTAGIKSLYILKPAGHKIIIKVIGARTFLDLKYGIWNVSLIERQHTHQRFPLCHKIFANAKATPITLFDGSREWPEGWRMFLSTYSQETSDKIYYDIGYEIEELPKKKGWGA